MPLFSYRHIDEKGKKVTGLLEAHTLFEAKERLRDRGVLVLQIQERKGTSKRENLKGEQLLSFTLQLSQLISSGVPLYESLFALEEQYRQDPVDRVLLSLCDEIKAGNTLSSAMHKFPLSFDRLYCAMVAAGEASGSLDMVLAKLTELLQKRAKLKSEISSAMIYPGVLATFSVLVIMMLLGYVIPSIEGIFSAKALNGYTAFIVGASHAFRNWWWLYLPLLLSAVGFAYYRLRSYKGKVWLQRQLMRLPLIRTLIIETAVARFCRTMATLLKGGVPLVEALKIARETMNNPVLEEEMIRAEAHIIEGSSLSRELLRSQWFPPLVPRMLAVGEEAGALEPMLNKIASMYEDTLEKSLAQALTLAQPLILIVMGAIIGSVIIAILLPLTDMSSFAL